MKRYAVAAFLLVAVAGCSTPAPPAAPVLTPAQRDDMFWAAYRQRLGLDDLAGAKDANVAFGHLICDQLRSGRDRGVLTAGLVGRSVSADEARVQVDTAVEFLCPGVSPS